MKEIKITGRIGAVIAVGTVYTVNNLINRIATIYELKAAHEGAVKNVDHTCDKRIIIFKKLEDM